MELLVPHLPGRAHASRSGRGTAASPRPPSAPTGERWFLLNASPDVHAQLACLPGAEPAGMRHVPVEGVVLTDAELDHTLGIVLLREARYLQVYATPAVREHPGAGLRGSCR